MSDNPTVIVLLDDQNNIVGVSSNISPEIKVGTFKGQALFNRASDGLPFRRGTDNDNPRPNVRQDHIFNEDTFVEPEVVA